MIYTDEENVSWWAILSKFYKYELLNKMRDKMHQPFFATNLIRKLDRNEVFSPKQIAAIRKWDR